MRYTLKDFKAEYPDDRACLMAVLKNRHGNTCPRCGVVGVTWHPISGRQGFVCSECDRHVYPLADTIFRSTTTPLWSWFYAIYQFSVSKNGVSAKELERTLGVTYKTAWRMANQIRKLMADEVGNLGGSNPVETDETYIGGRKRGAHGSTDKSVVFGMVERDGFVKAEHVRSQGARVILPKFLGSVLVGSTVYSDEAHAYRRLNSLSYYHSSVAHGVKEYVRGKVHTNTIEGFWSQLKRSIDGTYHVVSPKYLQSYVDEFAFRYNLRAVPIWPALLERVGKRVELVS